MYVTDVCMVIGARACTHRHRQGGRSRQKTQVFRGYLHPHVTHVDRRRRCREGRPCLDPACHGHRTWLALIKPCAFVESPKLCKRHKDTKIHFFFSFNRSIHASKLSVVLRAQKYVMNTDMRVSTKMNNLITFRLKDGHHNFRHKDVSFLAHKDESLTFGTKMRASVMVTNTCSCAISSTYNTSGPAVRSSICLWWQTWDRPSPRNITCLSTLNYRQSSRWTPVDRFDHRVENSHPYLHSYNLLSGFYSQ